MALKGDTGPKGHAEDFYTGLLEPLARTEPGNPVGRNVHLVHAANCKPDSALPPKADTRTEDILGLYWIYLGITE